MSIETTTYSHAKLIAGEVITRDDLPLAADTYYTGMPLKMGGGGTHYEYSATEPQAIYAGPDARVMSTSGVGGAIVGGEVDERGIVDSAGDTLTVTESMRTYGKLYGIFFKN